MTLVSFRRHHPDWEMVLVTCNEKSLDPAWSDTGIRQKYYYDGYDYMAHAEEYVDRVWTFDFEPLLKGKKGIHDVHRADMIRYYLMYNHGGVWSDMDVIYIGSLEKINLPENTDITTVLFPLYGHHTIGHLISSKGNPFYKTIHEKSHECLSPEHYQAAGSNIFNHHYLPLEIINEKHPDLVHVNLPYNTFYPFSPLWVQNIYSHPASTDLSAIPDGVTDNTVAIHWYGGHPATEHMLNYTLDSAQKDTIFNYYARAYADLLKS